jgi:diacylglycerol kinase
MTAIEILKRRCTPMSHYQQREIKDLYRAKDIAPTVVGVICAIAVAVWFARFFTGFAGI